MPAITDIKAAHHQISIRYWKNIYQTPDVANECIRLITYRRRNIKGKSR